MVRQLGDDSPFRVRINPSVDPTAAGLDSGDGWPDVVRGRRLTQIPVVGVVNGGNGPRRLLRLA